MQASHTAELNNLLETTFKSDDSTICELAFKQVANNDDIPLQKKLDLWLMILCGGKPAEVFSKLEKALGSSVCGKIWKRGDFSYQCKDCQFDETCAICVDCFKNGNHEGHDYNLHQVSGGCCDCGDAQAWRPSGFCRKHAGNNSTEDPIDPLPPRMKSIAPMVLRNLCNYTSVLIKRFLISCQPTYPADLPSSKALAECQIIIVNWMQSFAQRGDAFRRLIGNAITAPIADLSREVVLLWLVNMAQFPYELQKVLHDFFLAMFADQSFKRKFAGHFVKQYRALFFDSVSRRLKEKQEKGADILGLSVQLFTIPAFMEDLVKVHDSATILMSLLGEVVTSTRVKIKPSGLDGRHAFLEKNIAWHVLIDLRHIFSFVEASRYVLWEKEGVFRQLLEVFSWVQGSTPLVRQQGQHVEYETTEWFQIYGLSLELHPLMASLVTGLRAGPAPLSYEVNTEKLPQFARRALTNEESMKLQALLYAIVEQIRKFIATASPPLDWHRLKGCNMIDYDVSSAAVSFHLPLHRVFASMLSAACQQIEIQRLEQLIPAPAGLTAIPTTFVQQLIEHPLQLQVLLAQELAGLWVRNGGMIPQQVRLYRYYPRTYEMSEQDFLVLQVGAALLPPTLFLTVCADRFRLADYFQLHPAMAPGETRNGDSVAAILAEEFLRMLLLIATERSLCGALSLEARVEMEIVATLALGPMSFSQLTDALPEQLHQHKATFEGVLAKVADFVDPKGLKKGSFHLKSAKLSSFSQWIHSYHLHYSKKDQVALEENWKSLQKSLTASASPPASLPHPRLSSESILPSFRSLLSPFRSQLLFNVLFTVIYNTVVDQRPATVSLLQTALHALHCMIDLAAENPTHVLAAVEPSEAPKPDELPSAWQLPLQNVSLLEAVRTQIRVAAAAPRSLIELLVALTDTRNFQLEIQDEIQRILQQLSEIDGETRKIIESSLSQEQLEEERKRKVRAARAQQQRILQDFQNKQKAFAASIPREGDGDDDEGLESMQQSAAEPEEVCVLCKSATTTSPLAVIGYVHQSSVLPIALAAARNVPYVHVDESPSPPSSALQIYDRHFMSQQGLNAFARSTPSQQMFDELGDGEKQKFESLAKKDAERFAREDAECCHARHWTKMQEYPGAELLRNVNTLPSAFFSGCGHVVHTECHDGYMTSLWKQSEDPLAAALFGLQLEEGEFRCPACRSLGNVVLPKFSSRKSKLTLWKSSQPPTAEQMRESLARTMQQQPVLPQSVDSTAAIAGVLTFLQRSLAARDMISPEDTECSVRRCTVAGVLGQMVSAACSVAELASRARSSDHLFAPSNRVLLNHLLNALRHAVYPGERVTVFFSILLPILYPVKSGSKSPPLLSLDPFTTLVHCLSALDDPENNSHVITSATELSVWVILCLAASLAQNGALQFGETSVPAETAALAAESSVVFLRRTALLIHSLTGIAPPKLTAVEDPIKTVTELCTWLNIPTPTEILRWEFLGRFAVQWRSESSSRLPMPYSPPLLELQPYHFNRASVLPRELQTLGFYSQSLDCRCQKCGKASPNTAICLICGTYVCALSPCCMDPDTREGEATVHAAHCSGGVGVFMLLRETIILLMRNGGACLWASLYLDAHGEEDEHLRRGKPLYLDPLRYEKLRLLWLENGIPQETVASERPIKASSWWTF